MAEKKMPYYNRELSWMDFNARVLEEAEDSSVPLFDRFRFLSIFSENLDEFLMVRAGRLLDRRARGERTRDQKSGLTPGERLGLILAELPALSARRDEVFRKLEAELGGEKYPLVLANIVADVIKAMAPLFARYLKEDGTLVVSGIISERAEEVTSHLEQHGFQVCELREENDWAAAVLKRA